MEINTSIFQGQRILFKPNNGWKVGTLERANLMPGGLWFDVKGIDEEWVSVPAKNVFFDARRLDDWEQEFVYSKEEFLQAVEEEQVSPHTHAAWMSDGEYIYYTVGKWNQNWLNKQPFEYVYCV